MSEELKLLEKLRCWLHSPSEARLWSRNVLHNWLHIPRATMEPAGIQLSFNSQKTAWVFLLVTIIGLGIILPTDYANAFSITDILQNIFLDYIIAPIIWLVSYVLLLIAWVFTYLASGILEQTMQPGIYTATLGTAFTSGGFINVGWTAIRDMANMFFILILLFIAFGTILRIEAYKAKRLLPALIIAIFLVNFSKIITLVVVDFSQIFMYELYNNLGTLSGARENLAQIVWDAAAFYRPDNIGWPQLPDAVGAAGACIFSWVLALTYIAMACFMLIRLAMLCILVILSPAVFLLWVLPSTKKYFSQWAEKLINYAMIGPVFVFFIWIASLMAQQLFDPSSGVSNLSFNIPNAGNYDMSSLSTAFATAIPFAVVIFMLLFSLAATRQMGIMGASMIYSATIGAAAGVGFAVGRWSKGKAIAGGKKLGRRGGVIARDKIGSKIPQEWKDKFKKIPVLRGGIMDYEAKRRKEKRGEIEKYREDADIQSDKLNYDLIKSRMTDPEEVAGRLESLAKRGKLSEFKDTLSDEEKKRIFAKAEYGGVDTDYLTNRDPRTVDAKKRKEEVHRMHEEGKLSGIEAGALKDKDLMETLRNELDSKEFERLYQTVGKEQQKAMMEGLKESFTGTFDTEDVKRRETYAKLSGKVKEAFEVRPGVTTTAGAAKAKEYVVKLKPGDIGKIDEEPDLKNVGAYITKAQLVSIRGELSANQKKIIKQQIQATRGGSAEEGYVNTSEGWAV